VARILIASTALAELRAIEPAARRRRLVARLSTLDPAAAEHRLCAPGRYRLLADGVRVLYGRRSDGTLVIVGVAAPPMP